VRLISCCFRKLSKWKGKHNLKKSEQQKIQIVIEHAVASGKPVRFWSTPDFPDAWATLIDMGVTVMNTDHVYQLSNYLLQKKPPVIVASKWQLLSSPVSILKLTPVRNGFDAAGKEGSELTAILSSSARPK